MTLILKRTLTSAAVTAALLAAPLAQATNGYFKIGYGSKNRGMAGAGMAYGQDSLAPAINPAALAGMGNRVDAGVELFNPQRESGVDATGMQVPDLDGGGPGIALGGSDSSPDSGATVFAIPNFGISMDLGGGLTAGVAVVANGGMNTRYNENIYTTAFSSVIGQSSNNSFPPPNPPGASGFAGFLEVNDPNVTANDLDAAMAQLLGNPVPINSSLGVNLSQLLITPTIAYQFNPHHSIGFSPIIAYQRFRAYGLGLFAGFSSDASKLTNRGDDDSWGYGARIGYQMSYGMFSFGASYTSKILMQEFDKYAGLFAEQGDFDIPSSYGAGIAFHPTGKLTIAADVTRINYSDVAAINNEGPTADQFFSGFAFALSGGTATGTSVSNPLGTNDGWGFGWDDVTVYKVGINYDYNSQWSFRAGYNYAESPYDKDQALFNILAPGLVEKHVTVGFSYRPSTSSELTVTYMHAFRNSVEYTYAGSGGFTGFSFDASNAMSQNALEASYAWKF
ncbi:MAG TPA: long-chain fatty acid transporter [Gammaproteobacteria bacterium]|nr:long-chain fatty acid transporter [Gammaproteobacteria bacterium]